MMVVATLLIAVGASDVARLVLGAALGWRRDRLLGTAVGVVLGAAVALGVGIGSWVAVLLFVPVWQYATRPGRYRAAAAAVGLLGLLVVTVLALGSLQSSPQGPVVTWYDALPYAGLAAVPPEVAAIVAGSILFLIESANVVVRLALAPLAAKEATAERRADDGAVLFRSPDDVLELPLPGGRLIGPLERILILALALAGQFTAIGAVVAAKGIIRFPEISKDSAGGSKAEFFIVGSLASWVLVGGAVALAGLGTA